MDREFDYKNNTSSYQKSVFPFSDDSDAFRILGSTTSIDVLGVSGCTSEKAIKDRYRRLVMKFHPDQHDRGSEAEKELAQILIKKITAAYQRLRV